MGAQLRSNGEAWDEAVAVSKLTMTRARDNVETLIAMLQSDGFVFEPDEGLVTFEPSTPAVAQDLDLLEQQVGELPLSLRSWIQHVGSVSLMGQLPSWEYEYTDPLVVYAQPAYVRSEYEAWQEDCGTDFDQGAFAIDIAPDYLHKADVSGGSPYGLAIPNPAADGLLLWEPHQTTLVNYLRIAFAWGGFPGWDRRRGDGWAAPTAPAPPELARWASRLLPI